MVEYCSSCERAFVEVRGAESTDVKVHRVSHWDPLADFLYATKQAKACTTNLLQVGILVELMCLTAGVFTNGSNT